jgi:hypothetical protein
MQTRRHTLIILARRFGIRQMERLMLLWVVWAREAHLLAARGVCVCVCVCVCVTNICMCVCVCLCTCVHVRVCVDMYVSSTYIYMSMCTCVCSNQDTGVVGRGWHSHCLPKVFT